jgi:hypothetical protein
MVGVLDALGIEQAAIAGHDWVRLSPGTRRCCGPIALAPSSA